ncbi:helix-turn-helix transcriptional regulator [Cupriavidus sp. UYPR2.512]|uniref:helix-turn-helix transcriptional regulator n=1 Tax=Cupriavidus sp. UYPR2.512 TaxID=1080187 RepID=UPI00037F18CA|nr:helix-turn-helix transcriptional regulator [Cupriavidus sp. UYPR2.512]UIF88653.1 helix-turn-helix transcriptional regulator [Cupriavidus necator]UIF89121.1 helix-turn-helix transcriptional regulator [Cupriavidus necator]
MALFPPTPVPTPRGAVLGTISTVAELGALVKCLRAQQHVTQQALAAFAGTGERFVVDLERGKPTVQLDKVLLVLDSLGLQLAVTER